MSESHDSDNPWLRAHDAGFRAGCKVGWREAWRQVEALFIATGNARGAEYARGVVALADEQDGAREAMAAGARLQ